MPSCAVPSGVLTPIFQQTPLTFRGGTVTPRASLTGYGTGRAWHGRTGHQPRGEGAVRGDRETGRTGAAGRRTGAAGGAGVRRGGGRRGPGRVAAGPSEIGRAHV